LRIQAKKLHHYAVEFFASLFDSKRAARRRKQFLSALGQVDIASSAAEALNKLRLIPGGVDAMVTKTANCS
jgi:hypothetical protein